MAKAPDDRYGSAAQLRDDLRRARTLPEVTDGGRRSIVDRRPLAVVAGVVAAALVIGAVAYAATRGGDDPAGGTQPTPASSSGPPSAADLGTATASLAATLQEQGALTRTQAECVAERWIDRAGPGTMQDAGFFDDDWTYVDQDRSAMTREIGAAAASAATRCT